MQKFILAPDSFKGTLSAREICDIEARVIRRFVPDAEIHSIPMADGGEGMVSAYLDAVGGQRGETRVSGPFGQPVMAEYGILPSGWAVAEMASAAGLPLAEGRLDPLRASTRGVGELLSHLAERGCKTVLLGLGGSCTNDCGVGMAAALGFRFLDAAGKDVEPLAANLEQIAEIVEPAQLPDMQILAACDVDNPLLGKNGATETFGAQKGADEALRRRLERGMTSFAAVLERHYGCSADVPGAGAAGGMGAAVSLLLGGTLQSGVELLLSAAQFDSLVEKADLVFTGEGRIDWQSAHGKVPVGVGSRCKRAGVPCLALCGSVGTRAEAVYDCGITAIFSATRGEKAMEELRAHSAENLEFLTESVLRLLTCGELTQRWK